MIGICNFVNILDYGSTLYPLCLYNIMQNWWSEESYEISYYTVSFDLSRFGVGTWYDTARLFDTNLNLHLIFIHMLDGAM